MIEAKIEISEADIKDIKMRLGSFQNKTPTVLARAINRTVTNIKKNMAQQTGGDKGKYNIHSRTIKKTLHSQNATRNRLEGYVKSSGSPILLSEFNAKIKPGPLAKVTYKNGKASPGNYRAAVKKVGGSKALLGDKKAFVSSSKAGLIFLQRHSQNSYPLKPLYGPSIPQMIENEESMDFTINDARSTLQKRIDAEIANILRKG